MNDELMLVEPSEEYFAELIRDWSSDVCSSDLLPERFSGKQRFHGRLRTASPV